MLVKPIKQHILLGLAIILLLAAGCTNPTESSVPLETLLAAPAEIQIADHSYVLKTFLWRDFMPISPPNGNSLIAIVWITERDSLDIPSNIDATLLWVVNGNEFWETAFSDEDRPPTPSYKLEKVARNGPKWGPHIYVDVIVRVVDGTGTSYLLRAQNQWIGRTD